jgi:hypothetical protein
MVFLQLELDMIDSNARNSTLFVTIFVETVNLAAVECPQKTPAGPGFSDIHNLRSKKD